MSRTFEGVHPLHPDQPPAPTPAEHAGAPPRRAIAPRPSPAALEAAWAELEEFVPNTAHMARQHMVSYLRRGPAHVAIDMLRTQVLQSLAAKGWRRVAVAGPTTGCGASFVAANLAISMARGEGRRVLLMDMDLCTPAQAALFGLGGQFSMGELLAGFVEPVEHLRRMGPALALGVSTVPEGLSAEILLEPSTAETLARIDAAYAPDVALFDLPPILEHDDLLAFAPQLDCVLMVIGGGVSTAAEVERAARLIEDRVPILAVVLNRAEG